MNAGGSTVAGHRPRVHIRDPRAPGLTLRDALVIFTRQRSARVLASLWLVALTARIAVGGFGGWDLVVIAALLGLHPFSEWVIHVGILHWRPRTIAGITIDTELAREHRLHHQSPHEPRHWYMPLRGSLGGASVLAGLLWLVMPTFALWLTWLVGFLTMAVIYEWTHYLCHTSYRPRGRLYRRVWRHHRFHHFKNEHYWMGVTMHMGDRVLHTMPSPRSVPTSPTCRDLLGASATDPAG